MGIHSRGKTNHVAIVVPIRTRAIYHAHLFAYTHARPAGPTAPRRAIQLRCPPTGPAAFDFNKTSAARKLRQRASQLHWPRIRLPSFVCLRGLLPALGRPVIKCQRFQKRAGAT
eukprot:2752918-Pyramimonas_sp.AAC.1